MYDHILGGFAYTYERKRYVMTGSFQATTQLITTILTHGRLYYYSQRRACWGV